MNSSDWVMLILAEANASDEVHTLTAGGWAVMIVSVASVLTLVSFCLYRVLNLPPVDIEEHRKGPLGIDTGDTKDMD